MELANAIEKIEKFGAPVNSQVMAGQYMNQNLPSLGDAKALIQTLTNKSCSERGKDERYVPYVAAYVVMLAVKAHVMGETVRMFDVLTEAKARSEKFLVNMAWTFVESDTKAEIENADPEIVKAGRAKKGAKKVLALKIYKSKINGKKLTRKEAIAVLMEEIGLSAAGASTYYANFKNGKWS